MDPQLVARLNEMWRPIYPYLAQWIGRWCPKKAGWILEIGPFSGGISAGLMRLFPHLRAICLISQGAGARSMRVQFEPDFETVVGSFEALPFGASFNMVIIRGAFFFLTPKIIRETYRVLNPQAYALLGGGYGPMTPSEEIAKIAEESKRLNYLLGKRWISGAELEEMVEDAGVERCAQILEHGGLWLLLKKDL